MTPKLFLLVLGVVFLHPRAINGHSKITDLSRAEEFLLHHNEEYQDVLYEYTVKSWAYYTNITNHNREVMLASGLDVAAYEKEAGLNASMFDWKNFQNETIRRWFADIADIGTAAMPDKAKLERLNFVQAEMEEMYSKGKVCLSLDNCLDLEPGLTRLMTKSRDYDELKRAWQGWREATGMKMKTLYQEFVELSNEAIRANGYRDTGEYWRSWYESDTFQDDLEQLLEQLKPLYRELHAFTRRKLKEMYGADKFSKGGHIPAHLLGNMWAQTWGNLFNDLQPYKDKQSVDVTPHMKEQNYTAQRMFKVSEEFFTSLGMKPMPQEFWDHSMIEKPKDGRDVVCHASAWDFDNQKDFRIKQCTDITMEDLITVHHEMGHIQYYLQYKHLPVVFRGGANPGFHEAVGDVLALSVATPKHLQQIGLLSNVEEDTESDINYMLSIALDKIAFLPFGYLMDQWRWSVFSGETRPDMYNTKWWQLRCKFQGISPPIDDMRDDRYFDPGAKYHIPANVPYIRYFVSFVIQFQFHKALCQAAGETGPLHKCDIYRSKEAGTLLSRALELGSSRPWPEVMEIITGQNKMNAGALLEYFQPLTDWLKTQNKGHETGWDEMCPGARVHVSSSNSTPPTMLLPLSILACLAIYFTSNGI